MERRPVLGGVLVALSAVQFGVVVVLGKWAVGERIPVEPFLAVRFAIAAIVLGAVVLGRRLSLDAAPGERRGLVILGGVGYAVEASLFFAGLRYGTAAAVTLLFYTYPVIVAAAHAVLGRGMPSRVLVLGLLLAVAGTGIVIGSSGGVEIDGTGVLLVLGAAASFSVYILGSESAIKRTSPLTASTWLCASATVGLVVLALTAGEAAMPQGWRQWAVVAATGLATAGAFVSFLAGLRRIGAVRTGVISTFEPLAAAVLAAMFLGETIPLGTIAGGALILAGAIAAVMSSRRVPAEAPVP
jgi:drug/metabolite transporter (DMT)-like permease